MAEERGFESLFLPEHTHIPVSRQTPYPGGGELPPRVQPHARPLRGPGRDRGGRHGAAQGRNRRLPGHPARSDRGGEGGGHASITSPAAASCSASAPGGTSRRWETTAPTRDTRFRRMRESVEAMKAIWTQDEAEYHGRIVDFDPIWCWPKPVQKPHPPVLVGGLGEKVLDRVVAYGDEWIPNRVKSPEDLSAADRRAAAARGGGGPRAHSRHGLRREARGAAAGAPEGGWRHALALFYLPAGRGGARAGRAREGGGRVGRLDELDLSLSLSKSESEERLDAAQTRLAALRLALGGKLPGYEGRLGPPVAVVLEGWDASGKGGALKRLVDPLDPRHVRVARYAVPTATRSGTTFFGASFRRCPARRDDGLRPLLVRPRARGARRGTSRLPRSGDARTRRSSDSSAFLGSRGTCW